MLDTHTALRREPAAHWSPDLGEDEPTMTNLLRKMANAMRTQYAHCTITLLAMTVLRAAQDFGRCSPREDPVLRAILNGVAKLKGKSPKKKNSGAGGTRTGHDVDAGKAG